MREVMKMAELKIEAPLAQFESEEEWVDFNDFQQSSSRDQDEDEQEEEDDLDVENSNSTGGLTTTINNKPQQQQQPPPQQQHNHHKKKMMMGMSSSKGDSLDNCSVDNFGDNFGETFSGSLEDLVNTFDDKITKCFCNYDENVEKFAPVQVRTQEEIMNECQMWWTITGNFGNIFPIDWSKSHARRLHLPTLNLNEKRDRDSSSDELDCEDEDEDVAKDLDLHSLIISSLQQEPLFTAEEVLEEIEEIMQQQDTPSTEGAPEGDSPTLAADPLELKGKAALTSPLYEEKLKTLSLTQLNELFVELESMIKDYSETLIQELALRDELEYEKELKNTFISLLLSVQNKRRQYNLEKKRKGRMSGMNGLEPKYLTTVIPYHTGMGTPSNQSLQVLIKILQAINEDSPTVPTLLTDYILKVLCPT